MNLVTSQTVSWGAWWKASLFVLFLGLGPSISDAQITNGVFDPSKVMVAKEKVKELQTFQQNIVMANEFNRTLGTPAHPRPHLDPPEGAGTIPGAAPGYGPPQVPDFDINGAGKKRRGLRRKNQPSPFVAPDAPFAEANKVEPMVEAIPLPDNPDRISPPDQISPPDMNISSEGGPVSVDIPGSNVDPDTGLLLDANSLEGGYITEGGVLLPSNSSSPDGRRVSFADRAGIRKKLGRGKTRVHDTPRRSIPISVGSGANTGNPYSNENFVASSGYSPLLDGGADLEKIRDMTATGALPLPTGATGIAERGSRKATADTSQYYVVKKDDLLFQPFRQGTEEVDPDYAFELYSGVVVKDLGLIGTKRKVQVDSGETGLVSKDGIRPLSITEESTMAIGIEAGKPWYSILDTDAEF